MALGYLRKRRLTALRSEDSGVPVGRAMSYERATLTDYRPFLVSGIREMVTYGDHIGQAETLWLSAEELRG